ncbi:Rieske 2Fe-2S domain-containing protein [Facilibium subflavum]|uniref:Rieske 2Fe-2S domain-containing protein n=1 Tax=Facilibium subflavum TaxID=2219058 RepID=UPI000E656492|nr:Rieske 2Fe-2S domain-containing protein [Facilibium subflavum]
MELFAQTDVCFLIKKGKLFCALPYTQLRIIQNMPVIVFNGKKELFFTTGGKYYRFFTKEGNPVAADYTCPHRGAPLFYGKEKNNKLKCPLHGNCFHKEKIEQRQLPVVTVNTTSFVVTYAHDVKILDKLTSQC